MTSRTIRRLGLIAAAFAALATASSAQAVAYLQLGTSNASNATTTLTGSAAGAELKVEDTNGSVATAAVLGLLTATSPTVNSSALRGQNNATNGLGFGVSGSHAGAGIGVNGFSPRGIGVRGQSTSGIGVVGQHLATTGTAPGVSASTSSTADDARALVATVTPTSPGVNSMAVRGINNGTGSNGVGVFGYHGGAGYGVWGSTYSGIGADGYSYSGDGVRGSSGTGLAGYFFGNVTVSGTLTKGGGAFRIDHPLDPAHRYLQHSFVESPDMMDVYNGNVRTNRKGFATVRLPKYFQALNRSFRYQLTIVGRSFARAIVWKRIEHNRFTIRTDRPKVEVSWQVTGIRHDRYANANRIKVVLPKPRAERGKYLHPELYDKPKSEAIGYVKPPRILQRPSREH